MFTCDQPHVLCSVTWNESRTPVSNLNIIRKSIRLPFSCSRHRYSRRILVGLIFCCIGDAFLVFPDDYFEIGMISFGIGHISYILAFGFKPLNLSLGVFLYALNATGKKINTLQNSFYRRFCRYVKFTERFTWYFSVRRSLLLFNYLYNGMASCCQSASV